MSTSSETLEDLIKRRDELIRKKKLLEKQTACEVTADPFISGIAEPGPSNSPIMPCYSSDDSVADPDFVPPSNVRMDSETFESSAILSLQLEDVDNFPERNLAAEQTFERKRKRKADMDSWKREGSKKQRMMGKEYVGFRKAEGKYVQDVTKPKRKLGVACSSQRCVNSKVFACNTFTEEMRLKIFDDFWAMTWKEKKLYVLTLIDVRKTQRKTKGVDSRRNESKIYYLKTQEKKERVCQGMFLSTLGIKEWTCRYWIGERAQSQAQEPVDQGSADQTTKTQSVLTFLQGLPKLPSHYCRKSSNKLYLEPIIQSKAHLYRLYVEHTNSTSSPLSCRKLFEDLFSEQNIALFKPKKDACDTCSAYKVGNITEEDYQRHTSLKEAARQEKKNDKEAAIEGTVHVITADLQAVMLCPYLNASALYFKTKLCVHNFTVYNLMNHEVTCYWFDETVTDLKATTYASFFVDYITKLLEKELKNVIIYTDGCTSQNRNNVVSNALLRMAIEKNITITQKFLEKGHTQMEVDSVHSVIERKLKNREIYLPSQYASIAKEARMRPFPYNVVMSDYTFFKDYSQKDYQIYDSIRPGRVAGDNCVTDIRVLRYNSSGTIEYKLTYSEDFKPLPRRPKPLHSLLQEAPHLHDGPQRINKTKYNHLQELKAVIPQDCNEFYNNLIYHD